MALCRPVKEVKLTAHPSEFREVLGIGFLQPFPDSPFGFAVTVNNTNIDWIEYSSHYLRISIIRTRNSLNRHSCKRGHDDDDRDDWWWCWYCHVATFPCCSVDHFRKVVELTEKLGRMLFVQLLWLSGGPEKSQAKNVERCTLWNILKPLFFLQAWIPSGLKVPYNPYNL